MSQARIFRHSAAWSVAAGGLSTAAVANGLLAAVADAPKRTVATVLILAAVLAVVGAMYGGWLAWRRRASVVSSAMVGLAVILNIVALVLAVALAVVVQW